MARGTSTDAMRHARPRGRAARGPREPQVAPGWRGHVAGGHASPPGRPGGARWQGGWQVKGPRVSGRWLEYYGRNAIALNHLSSYTQDFRPFSPSGTKFPGDFLLQATSRHHGSRI